MAPAVAVALSRAGRKRSRVSYREPTTDEEDDQASDVSTDELVHSPDAHARKRRRQNPRGQDSQSQPSQPRATRRRNRTSYKEPSSEESADEELGASPSPPRRSRSHGLLSASPELATKLRRLPTKSYHLPSSDVELPADPQYNDEGGLEEAGPSRPRRTRTVRAPGSQASARLRREPAPAYTETNSDDCSEESDSDVGRRRARRQKRRRAPGRNTRSSTARKQATHGRSKATKRADRNSSLVKPLESDGIIPPWATLPYEILLDIFTYASKPLHDDDFNPTPNLSWLLNAARMCKSFTEPALTALYRSPPLLTIDKPHRLLELLSDSTSIPAFNYNVKIHQLEFDVIKTLAYTWTGKGQFELGDLIPHVPQLTELSIVHPQDRPPFRPFSRSGRWHYSQALFMALEGSSIHLKSWNWNSNFRTRDQTLFWIGNIHQMEAFQRLEHLSLLNFGRETLEVVDGEAERTSKQVLADNLAILPQLKSLSFESCQVLDEEFLPLLKDDLQSLTIVNCHDVTSDVLRDFLVTHGNRLKSLVLNHNQCLNISFLPDLKRACPRLEVFKMDLNYYDSHASFRDSDPKYVDLLKEDEIPSWPSTLQTLEIVQLRKWTSGAAETFFASLIDSADELPNLRRLILKAILNIGWRDRAGFRDQWIGRLQRVFLRKSPPPNPNFMSGKRFRMWKESFLPITPDPDSPPRFARKLSHVQATPRTDISSLPTPENNAENSGMSRRLRPRRALATSAADTDTNETSEDNSDSSKDWRNIEEKAVQGMCEIVDIRIDNLRPREEQFNENDFLDSEASGDEDWNGDDDMPGDDRYAW